MNPENPDIEKETSSRPEVVPSSGGHEFVLRRHLNATPERVFEAWTDPELMKQWFGPKDFTTPVCELDVRPQGQYRIVMRGPDGMEYPMKGAYREISPREKLVYTEDIGEHPKELLETLRQHGVAAGELHPSVATIRFEESSGDSTRLTVSTVFETAKERDAMMKIGMAEGWSESFDRLEALLAAKH